MSILSEDEELITALKAYLQAGAIRAEQLRVKLDFGEISLKEFLKITKDSEQNINN
jgi:hypothetical protein